MNIDFLQLEMESRSNQELISIINSKFYLDAFKDKCRLELKNRKSNEYIRKS